MESFSVSETIHDHVNLFAAELRLDAFQCPLQTEPKVDLLRRSPRANVASELGDRLNGLDPLVDVTLEGVEEGTIVELLRRNIGDTRS